MAETACQYELRETRIQRGQYRDPCAQRCKAGPSKQKVLGLVSRPSPTNFPAQPLHGRVLLLMRLPAGVTFVAPAGKPFAFYGGRCVGIFGSAGLVLNGSRCWPVQHAANISLTVCDSPLRGSVTHPSCGISKVSRPSPTQARGGFRLTHFHHGTKLDILSAKFPETP